MKKIFSLLMLLSIINNAFGQETKLNKADKKYDKYSYIDAIEIYEKVAEKGYKSVELFQKLGNAYYFNSDLPNASKWYGALFNLNETVEPEYYFRYAQALKAEENYEKSNYYMELFNEKTTDSRGKLFNENKNYLKDIEAVTPKYKINKTDINSEFYDYGPSFFGNQIVFTSSRSEGNLYSKIHDWTKQNFTDLFVAQIDSTGKLENVTNFSTTINTKFNESSPVFTKDGKTMYFTRNNYNDGKKRKSDDKEIMEKIYRAEFINGEWTNVKELPFCSDNYKTAHPALSPDEKTLFFVSNMPGTIGNADLYQVAIKSNGSFGKPENLGPTINTEGRETFPFVAADNTLFFASNGHPGLGGLDIFEAKFINNGYAKPVNVGKPINSSMDDFGYVVNSDNLGFFTSNRTGGTGFDDIYTFTICTHLLSGVITDAETNEILINAKVVLFDDKMNEISETYSSDKGVYSFKIDCNKAYFVRASKEEYETSEKPFGPVTETGKSELNIELKRNVFPIQVGTDLAKLFNISIIYFDLDKWDIRQDAAEDLEKILAVMNKYPEMTIDIRSHTDSRQTHAYNELLSDRRAKATLEFMVKSGINRNRLTAKGYGETQLVNECSDGILCSEEDHQKNRRSEFIVMKM
ncbi:MULTISPECIES: OmpA family protein [unclassified Flavobacterium]|uniref:OmpA family protein n=1 Tax=unclassified Flavobacterium TaxID=196869 RepID=UPI001292281A|nr:MULTISPECIES: OmpA family protein [unclassified Flavobacterium]MQP52322.1 OmpA family protein [Flavobacterium sp. LMO9]MQP62392.1 OmpA family protein [Flavobacterium sp. LMO6]